MQNIDLVLNSINGKYFKLFTNKRNDIVSEEDLRIAFSSLLDRICKDNSIKIPEEHHEYTVLKGRIDSIYGEVIIEYKEPHYLENSNNAAKNSKAILQIKKHIIGIEERQKKNSNRFLGVIFDGYKVIFVRKRNNIWDIEAPIDLSEDSFRLLLQRLFSVGLQGKALIIDNLIQDFSILSEDIKQNIKTLLNCFLKNNKGKVNLLYEQWKILFREVCGYDFDTKKLEMQELLDTFHLEDEVRDLSKIIFAIHTYYALFIKLLGAETLTYFRKRENSFLSTIRLDNLKYHISSLEDGSLFKTEGINNFNEGDFFSWYLLSWDENIKKVISEIIAKLKNYDFCSLNLEPKEAKDLIKNIYHYLLPQKLRHSLGEYYTPDWLAEFLINNLNIDFSSDIRVLDPTCGSGTFLSILIEKILSNTSIPNSAKFEKILNSVVGIDLNPLAVIAAKTNYLIALSDFLKNIGEGGIDIPIFLSDSLLAPLEYKMEHQTYYSIPTKVGVFKIPANLIKKRRLDDFLKLVIVSIETELELNDFKKRLLTLKLDSTEIEDALIYDFYSSLLDLQRKGLNGIWVKIIKNIFAPAFFENFDYVVGNPPWINWQNLPEDYRASIKKYWEDYKIFLHKGLTARLGSSHDDISVLLMYVVADKYLKSNGLIGFVIPQNLFQASGGGDGFRRFQIKDQSFVKVLRVDDYVNVKPFADIGASNKTATVIIQKGQETTYPISYFKWNKIVKGTIPSDHRLTAISPLLKSELLYAEPIKDDKKNSSWIIAKPSRIKELKSLVGHSNYKARKGVDFSLNGLFWGKILNSKIKDTIIFENQGDIGKKKLKHFKIPIEKDLIFSILRGKNITRWQTAPEYHAIIPYSEDGKCLSVNELKNKYPNTYKFFYKTDKEILKKLEARGIYQKHLKNAKVPVYGLYDIGSYTFSKYKVVWKALASGMIASVISSNAHDSLGNRLVIPDHNVLMVPFDNENEAFYLCGILNSQIINDFVVAYISWFYSSHILEHIKIPDYNNKNEHHLLISKLSKRAHLSHALSNADQDTLNQTSLNILLNK